MGIKDSDNVRPEKVSCWQFKAYEIVVSRKLLLYVN